MTTPLVSIVIPTHDRKDLLLEMLEWLGHQEFSPKDLEVIVVLDGCTDNTLAALKEAHTPYALCAAPQAQAGPSAARNNGARLAKGDVLVFMDDDLLPMPMFLERHIQFHRQDERALVLGRFLPERHARKQGWHIWEEQIFAKHYRYMEAGKRPPAGRRLYSGNFSLRREQFLAAGGFDERLKRGEDVELGFRLEKAGLRFYFSPEAAAIHRGYRSFESWCNSAYLYGRTDVQLARERGHQQVLPEIRGWYRRLHPAMRRVVGATLGHATLHKQTLAGLRAAGGVLTTLHGHKAAHYTYSGIYKLQYWRGVADELGGREAFRENIAQGPANADPSTAKNSTSASGT